MRRSKVILLVVVFAASGVFAGWRVWQAYQKKGNTGAGGQRERQVQGRVVSVSLTRAQMGSVREEIEITGSLKPKEQVDVSAQITGRIRTLNVMVGDSVRRGEVIAELEDAELAQQVRRAEAAQAVVEATVQQRRAELSNAENDLNRARQLVEAGLLSRQDFDTKQTSFRVVQSQLALTGAQREQALAELNELKIRLQQMRIRAPMPGQIAQRFVDVGAVVSASTPIVRLVNLSTLVTLANVPEREISKLRVGNRAIVHVDAFGDKLFEGRVARVSPVLDPATRTALVEVEIPNPEGTLKAEMFARVKLDLATQRRAVLIPRDALVYRGQQSGVYVYEGERPAFRSIETGSTQGQQIEVVGNLPAGTTIVNRGAAMLDEGDRVRVVEEEAERQEMPARPGARMRQEVRTSMLLPTAAIR
jgi:RND family efflux transporter MFP subunit